MKQTILTAIAMFCAVGVFAQGTVVFNNRTGGTSHVWGSTDATARHQIQGNAASGDSPAGATSYAGCVLIGSGGLAGQYGAGSTWTALLAANGANAPEATLLQGNGTTTFRTGTGAGNIAPVTTTFNNVPKDANVATIEMVAWDNSSGNYSTWALASVAWNAGLIAAGRSAPFNLNTIGGDTNTPPNLIGLTSFNIFQQIPEPTSIALAGLGAAALVIFRRRK